MLSTPGVSPPPVVTISSAYGAGGGFIGPQVAERLGVDFVDRAITAAVAADLAERTERVATFEDDLGTGMSHWLTVFADPAGIWGGMTPPPGLWFHDTGSYKRHVDLVLHHQAGQGAVILGRGAQIVLRDVPRALHVRLDGPLERRIDHAVELAGIEPVTARRAQHHTDTARHRRLYHSDVADPRLYHLVIDATAMPWATCVEIIVAAVRGREGVSRQRCFWRFDQ